MNGVWPLQKSYYILLTIFESQTVYRKQEENVLLLHFHLIFLSWFLWILWEPVLLENIWVAVTQTCEQRKEETLIASCFHFSVFSSIQHKGSRLHFSGPLSFRLHKIEKQNHLFLFLPRHAAARTRFSPKYCWCWVLCQMRLLGVISITTGTLFYYSYI